MKQMNYLSATTIVVSTPTTAISITKVAVETCRKMSPIYTMGHQPPLPQGNQFQGSILLPEVCEPEDISLEPFSLTVSCKLGKGMCKEEIASLSGERILHLPNCRGLTDNNEELILNDRQFIFYTPPKEPVAHYAIEQLAQIFPEGLIHRSRYDGEPSFGLTFGIPWTKQKKE